MKSLQVITLGCSKNDVDTGHILAQVQDRYVIRDESWTGPVDIQMLNTCGFIGDAKEESVNAIMASVARRKAGEIGRLVVFGCLSQRYMKDLPSLIPEVDEWYGAREISPILKSLGVENPVGEREAVDRWFAEGALKGSAYLKISEGCDKHCSYCAISGIRGPHRSVPMEVLVEEARRLAGRGVKELILIAQDTTYYGMDLYHRRALADLLRALSALDGIEWIRIHYSYPDDFPEDVLDEMASNPKICRYLDIPLQHVSDVVLKNMRRGVTGEWTRSLIARMREKVPGVVLRTTMIVGHPGEGRKEFNELVKFVQDAHFERLGAFKYSEEEGTWGARNLRDSVTPRTKQSRLDRLMTAQAAQALAFSQSRIGKTERVIVDDLVDGTLVCRSQYESPEVDGEILVKAPRTGAARLVGNFIDVRITGADMYDLTAEIL